MGDLKWIFLGQFSFCMFISDLDQSSVLTVGLLFPPQSEPDQFVSEAVREMLSSPAENRPASRHVPEDCWLLQVMQDPPGLL